jgi:hypothetical protein
LYTVFILSTFSFYCGIIWLVYHTGSRLLDATVCDAFCKSDAFMEGPNCGASLRRTVFSVSYVGGDLQPAVIEPKNVTVTVLPSVSPHAQLVTINTTVQELAPFTGLR